MSVAVLIVSHHKIGHALVEAVQTTLGGDVPLPLQAFAIASDADPDDTYPEISKLIESMDQGDGVLILTDLFGSTPCNICNKMQAEEHIMVVTGLNLPMLVRAMNYPDQSLEDLAETARKGGMEGIMTCTNKDNQGSPP